MTEEASKKYNDAATKQLWRIILHSSWWTYQEKGPKIKQLIADGADVNSADKDGKTLLMYACAKCYIGVVSLLLESGASILFKNKDGKTALDFAKDNDTADKEEIIALLEETPEVKQIKAEEEKSQEEAKEEANMQFNLAMLEANEHSVQEMLFLVLNELRSMNMLLGNIDHNTSLIKSYASSIGFNTKFLI